MYKTLPSIPGPPVAPFLKDRATSNALTVGWQKPADNGGMEVQTYVLQMNEGAGSRNKVDDQMDVYSGPNMSHRAEGLLPGQRYETRVSM